MDLLNFVLLVVVIIIGAYCITQINARMVTQQTSLTSLQTQFTSLSGNIGEIQTITALSANLQNAQQQIASLQTAATTNALSISTNTSNLTALQSATSGNTSRISALQASLDGTNNSVSTLQTSLAADEATIATIQSKQAADEANITSIQNKQAADEMAITVIQNKQTASDANITSIQTKQTADESSIAGLQSGLQNAIANPVVTSTTSVTPIAPSVNIADLTAANATITCDIIQLNARTFIASYILLLTPVSGSAPNTGVSFALNKGTGSSITNAKIIGKGGRSSSNNTTQTSVDVNAIQAEHSTDKSTMRVQFATNDTTPHRVFINVLTQTAA